MKTYTELKVQKKNKLRLMNCMPHIAIGPWSVGFPLQSGVQVQGSFILTHLS